MDEETQRWLMSNVDAHGKPKWDPATLDDLSEEEIEGIPDEFIHEFLEDTWSLEPTVDSKDDEPVDPRSRRIAIGIAVGIFLLAMLPRLYVLFFVTDPQNAGAGWYGDTYHHWQIAYFTKEIGLAQGFRLWDLKGMEYFWGPIHPLLLSALFVLTGSTDIVLTRLLSIVFGSVSCVLIYYIGRRLWNTKVGVVAMFFAALNPVGLFNDASGMVEPVGTTFLLAGLYFWPRKGWVTGIMWALAGMLRAEYWLFGAGLIAAAILTTRERSDRKFVLALGWIVPVLLYMKFLLDRTGNPIYPIYWSFLGNALGEWQAKIPMGPEQIVGRTAFLIVLFISIVVILLTFWKKPRFYLLNLLGFGNLLFLGVFVGLTAYALSYRHYFWVVRIFVLPYMILGLLLAAFLFSEIPSRWPSLSRLRLGWVSAVLVLLASQAAWIPIWHYYAQTISTWGEEVIIAEDIASAYEGGTALIPEGDPNLTYILVNSHGFTAHNLLGQMYDPFAYFTEDNPFSVWDEKRQVVERWFKENDIRLLAFYSNKEDYQEMIRREPWWFQHLGTTDRGKIEIYKATVQ